MMNATEIKTQINAELHIGEGEIVAISDAQTRGSYLVYRITVSDARPGCWKIISKTAYSLFGAYADADSRGSKTGTLKIRA